MMTRVDHLFSLLAQSYPSPTTELHYTNDYQLLIAVVLSAQSTDKGVNKATTSLFKIIKNPQQLLEYGLDALENSIKTIGLFRNKAKFLIKLSEQLIEKHNGIVPDTIEDLMALSGVGRKTANVVMNASFGHPTIAVDTHVYRVSKRLGLSQGKTTEKVEQDLINIIPEFYKKDAHHLLILHGRRVCKAQKPKCQECILKMLCPFPVNLQAL